MLGPLCLASFMFGLVTAIAQELPALDPSRQHPIEVNGTIVAGDGKRVLAVLRGSESRVVVPSSDIAPLMKQAIVAVEDKRFYEHRGVDYRGILRAVMADVTHKGVVEGGSTITQQFVKNTYLHDQRTIARKLKEAALAWQLEQHWTKDRILTAYLNTIYFGNGAYGVQQAAETYFGHGVRRLTLPEAALLAGIPSDPSLYDPAAHPQAARERRDLVLYDMLQQGDITQAQYDGARAEPLPKPQDIHLPGDTGPAQYFTSYVKQQLLADKRHFGSAKVFGGGLQVKTTIDLHLQELARNAISKWLTDPNGPSAALVSIDPQTGDVLAMFGGSNYRKSQFNLAVQGERQPGSSFKPFVLATALADGISPQTTFVSAPIKILADGRIWDVHNYEDSYLGAISLATATTESDNSVYAQLTRLVGPRQIVKTAKALGITSKLKPYYAIGLGAQAVNPLEMARAYSAFANGGHRIDGKFFGNTPRAIEWVKDSKGHMLADNRPVARERPGQVGISSNTAALVDELLQNVVKEGTGRAAQLPDGRPVAGKTGTTENYGDAWFVGFTPNLVTAVWVGYPNKLVPMTTEFHGGPVAGGTYPALIWKSFMETALPYLHKPALPFPTPTMPYQSTRQVVVRDGRLELDNGLCRDTQSVVWFSSATSPPTADCKLNEVDVPRVVGYTLAAARKRLEAQPLTPTLVFKPARTLQRVGVVVGQYPSGGTLSSYDKVTLVMPKALHGVVPKIVGLPLAQARAKLARAHLGLRVRFGDGNPGHVVSQAPLGGVAAAKGMTVDLVVGRVR